MYLKNVEIKRVKKGITFFSIETTTRAILFWTMTTFTDHSEYPELYMHFINIQDEMKFIGFQFQIMYFKKLGIYF